MIELTLPDMTCGHCAAKVSAAIARHDPAAKVAIELPTKQVKIETQESLEAIRDCLMEAGYPPAQP